MYHFKIFRENKYLNEKNTKFNYVTYLLGIFIMKSCFSKSTFVKLPMKCDMILSAYQKLNSLND